MTISEAINTLDSQKHNTFSRQDKLGWLSRLDGQIHRELLCAGTGQVDGFSGYTTETDPDTKLLVPAPWDEIYLHYMTAQIDYLSGELTRYTNAALLYNTTLASYVRHYNRTHTPQGYGWKYF